MKNLFHFIAITAIVLGICSCNTKIENPSARNLIGTWDLQRTEIISPDGTVTSSQPKTLDYLVITENSISFYDSDKLSKEARFAVKDNVIYVDGVASYDIDNLTRKEMTLSVDGFGLLVSSYKYYYKKR
ncbi:MAG: hypothetical protein J5640_08245 [Bacteroidales bacterium]|nr:hypothetical protein [Bacteroidales bacterium]